LIITARLESLKIIYGSFSNIRWQLVTSKILQNIRVQPLQLRQSAFFAASTVQIFCKKLDVTTYGYFFIKRERFLKIYCGSEIKETLINSHKRHFAVQGGRRRKGLNLHPLGS
jgi:hypothetical protein